jgi:hypothetical protein
MVRLAETERQTLCQLSVHSTVSPAMPHATFALHPLQQKGTLKTTLHYVARSWHTEAVAWLIAAKAKVDAKDTV